MSDQTTTPAERRVVANVTLSMDGFTADPDGGMGWLLRHATDDQVSEHFEGSRRAATTVLLGRTNYEGFFGYWPTVAEDPASLPRDRALAEWLDAVEKVVFSRTLEHTEWKNSRVATREFEAEVREIKRAVGGDILVLNSASIIQQLLRSELLDEFRLLLVPAILGGGLRLFPEGLPPSTWRLTGALTVATGAVALSYRRAEGS